MSLTSSSLTSFDKLLDNGPIKEHNHLSDDKLHISRQTNPISPRTVPSLISTTKSKPLQGSRSLGRLAGYVTSDGDEHEKIKRATKSRSKKSTVYKSAEFVASDSGEPEGDHPPPRPARSSRTGLALDEQSQISLSSHRKRAMGTVPNISSHNTCKDKERKTIAKRPNTKGGFVMDSESDDEGSDQSGHDENDNQSRSSTGQLPHALEPPRSMHANLNSGFDATPMPTKQLNKNRLNKLLGRVKGVSTTPKQKQSLVDTQRSITTTPTPSITSRLTTLPGLQQSADSRDADRSKCPTTADTRKEAKVPSQQAKNNGKTSSIFRETQRPTLVSTDDGRVPMQTSPTFIPPTTGTASSSSSLLLQQRRPVPGANIVRERKNGTVGNKTSSAIQSRSLLQLTLDQAKNDTMGSTLGVQPQARGQDEQNTAKRAPVLTMSIRKPGSIPQRCVQEQKTTAADTTSKKCSSSTIKVPRVSGNVASQRAQRHTQAPDPGPRNSTPGASRRNEATSKHTPSAPKLSAQKRKLDSISSESDHISAIAPKMPALSSETRVKRLKTTPAISKSHTSSRSVSTSQLPSLTVSTSAARQESGVPDTSNLCASEVVSHLPARASKVATDKPVEKSRTSKVTSFHQTKPVDRPDGLATVRTKPNSGKPQDSTEHASMAHDTASAPSNEMQATDLAESTRLERGLSGSTENIENAERHSEETLVDNTEMIVESVDNTAVFVDQGDANAEVVSVPSAADDHEPLHRPETAVETKEYSLLASLEPATPKRIVIDALEIALIPLISSLTPVPPSLEVATDSNDDVLPLSSSPKVSKAAQPYFEYTVFQKVWSSEQTDVDIAATEITVRPFINIAEANGQAEKTFQASRAHFLNAIFESSNKRDEHGCSIFNGSATPFDDPTKKIHLSIWVQRDIVSKLANQTPQTLQGTSFVSSTCYILRLFNLAEEADTEDSDDSDSNGSESPACKAIRVYHPHIRPEVYTTLHAANRAARALQIELSHEKEPKDAYSKTFQEKNLKELKGKLCKLQSAGMDGGDGCWKSKFNACGLGGDTLEVVVEKTNICGPRNL